MAVNGVLATKSIVPVEVIEGTHGAIIRGVPALADNGVLEIGLLVAKDSNGKVIPYNPALTQSLGTGDNTETTFSGTLTAAPLYPGSLSITDGTQTVNDDGSGRLYGDGTGTINYVTGAVSVTWTAAPATSADISATYANKLMGVLTHHIDTAQETLARVVCHGSVVRSVLTVSDGSAPDQVDVDRLDSLTVFAI